jgi:GINS complex subunit 4
MDDIDDILASVDRDTLSVPQAAALDHQILTRFWVAERGTPEVLPWPEKLMERVMERVSKQVCSITHQRRAQYFTIKTRRC